MFRFNFPLLVTFFLIPFFLISSNRVSAQTPDPIPISISSTGEPGNGDSSSPSISADGRWIAFASDATNLVPDDTNGVTDIFVHDRQTRETTRVSLSTNGEQGNGDSFRPQISGNGRFVAFMTLADNLVPADSNAIADIYVYDRLTKEVKRASVGNNQEQSNGWSDKVTISFDGRYLAFDSGATNLVRGDNNLSADVFIFDNGVTGRITRASVSSENVEGNFDSYGPVISGDGRVVAYMSEANNLTSDDTNQQTDIFIYNRVLAQTGRISTSSTGDESTFEAIFPQISFSGRYIAFVSQAGNFGFDTSGPDGIFIHDSQESLTWREVVSGSNRFVHYALSSDGKALLYPFFFDGLNAEVRWQNIATDEIIPLTINGKIELGQGFDLSRNGDIAVFPSYQTTYSEKLQIFIEALGKEPLPNHFISGRVTDSLSHPLALVTVTDQLGNSTRTDKNGYFWLAGYAPGSVTLTLEKEGYTLSPSTFNLELSADISNLTFIAAPEKPLEEARLDLGMPYKFDRGCPDPNIGCGGKYHGFTSGYCTDLILDAYTYGADFDIQFDLEQNTRTHPEHFYRWHDARDAHDMWRFFSYSGQMLPHAAPYAPGDIVFFDWTEDGEIDHVALVSEVDELGHPVRLLDATGKTDYNPTGLAADLEWQEFHERTQRGHARWSGAYQPVIPFPARPEMLQIAASGGNVNLRLSDASGGALSLTESTLPGGWYTNLIWEESTSVEVPTGGTYTAAQQYTAAISNPTGEPAPYRLTIQLVVNGIVIGRVEASGNLPPGSVQHIPVFVELNETGGLELIAQPSRIPKIRGALTRQ